MLRKSSEGGGVKRGHASAASRHHSDSLMGSTKTWDVGHRRHSHNLLSDGADPSVSASCPPGVDPEYVMMLVNDVRWFANVLLHLKEAFQSPEGSQAFQQVVQERLAELLRVLKAVIAKHQALNSVDILGKAGTLIAKVKGINFDDVRSENRDGTFGEIHASIDTLAFTFGNVVSDFLMGDVDNGSGLGTPQTRRSRSFDNLAADPEDYAAEKNDLAGPDVPLSREEEVDLILLKHDSGVESALLYAKAWSKYIKDLLAWMDKRVTMDAECAKSYAKLAESAKSLVTQQEYMPFSDVYNSTFKNDVEYNQLLLQTAMALQTNKFIQPLLGRKNELDKLRKDLKEQWQKEQKKMHEADVSLRKARALKAQRQEEYQKVRSSTSRSVEEQPGAVNKQLERNRKLLEEALQRAEEAQEQYQNSMADAGVRRMDLSNVKRTILTQIRETVFQCDLTLKAVTVNWFQMQHAQMALLPAHLQALSDGAKLYEPGECYSEFVRRLPRHLPRDRVHSDSVSSDGARFVFAKRSVGSSHSSHGNLSQASLTSCDVLSGDEVDSPLHRRPGIAARRSNSSTDIPESRNQAPPSRAWTSGSPGSQGGMCSDSESAGGSSESRSMDSPSASPGDFKRRLPRTPSTGTMSSADDLDEREPLSPLDNGLAEMVTETASSPGPFRNAQMSKAAQTHKLRKLRAPSKCRECDSLVVFHGAECEECSLACHKKCLETLAIQCGHKKLQGKLQLFGINFAQASKNSADGIPFIIKKCTSEIESRALNIKGIYRMNGAKSRVEKLCQAFENGKDLVELSELSPHDISNVLKLYLRQLPEPLILYRYYNDFIGLAKEYQRVVVEKAQERETDKPGGAAVRLNRVVLRIRDLLRQLPAANYRTLHFLVAHLNRVAEQAEENKMTASNLGIIFGPTLVKPRQAEAEVSLSSLVDYPYQALMVELLVRHFPLVFDAPPSSESDAAAAAAAASQTSPVLTPQEKLQRLSRHSASLTDIKESAKVYKRFSSVIPSSHILDEVQEVQPGTDRTDSSDGVNGVDEVAGPRRSGPALDRADPATASATLASMVQLRAHRARSSSRPISLPATAESADPPKETAGEEPAEARAGSSRVSAYYITPFIDTRAMQRRTWDRKYRHYDVTPRTAMIVAKLPAASAAAAVPAPAGTVSTVFPNNPYAVSVKPAWTSERDERPSSGSLLTLRPPRTLQPPPGTFYKPPVGRAGTLPNRTATAAPTAPPSPPRGRLQTQDSTDSAIDAGAASLSPPQSPPPGSPDDPDPGETKAIYQRLRSRRLQELEHREAHFV
ncbi:rho GTPase-activating protein 29-like isoform X1 [Hippocampus zosterae]|uniref:rho GTPase-activating protein 29-like isoform X1 n=2 Tax=Hippocampus zosterae TaxID=109293 RepID=UPI00223CB11E|nr:rho GTPase-activating protein 29-like isoform X1 [Hippocampus zosterae]